MKPSPRRANQILLLVLLITGIWTGLAIFGKLPLSINQIAYPTNPFYNGQYGSSTLRNYVIDRNFRILSVPPNLPCSKMIPATATSPTTFCDSGGNNLYTTSGGTLYIPTGMAADSAAAFFCSALITCAPLGSANYFLFKMPQLPDGCIPPISPPSNIPIPGYSNNGICFGGRGFDLTGTVTGSNTGYLLTSANPIGDPTCNNYNPQQPTSGSQPPASCWAADYAVIQALPTPCIQGVTACVTGPPVTVQVNSTSITNPIVNGINYNGTFTKVVSKTTQQILYVYRLITSLTLQIVPPTPVLTTFAQGTCPNLIGGCDPTSTLRQAANNFVAKLNSVNLFTGTRIAFGIYVPAVAGFPCTQTDLSNGNCWFGIVGAWIGGQGIQTAGCTGINTCTFAFNQHAQLPLFSDPIETMPATIPSFGSWSYIASLTNQTLAQVTQQNVFNQIYTYLDTQNLGAQYSYGGDSNCTMGNLNGCITTPPTITINVPILYDVIGSKQYATWLTQYPNLPPSGGSNSGGIYGKVLDGSGNAISGACVGINGPCSGQPGQQQVQAGKDGSYQVIVQAPNTYAIYAQAQGYTLVFQSGIKVPVGASVNVNFVLQSTQPQGCIQILPPIYSGVPFQPPVFAGVCIPNWIIITIFVIVAGLIAFTIFLAVPSTRKLGVSARRGRTSGGVSF